MTEAEIREKINELEARKFIIYMVERWTNSDREMLREVETELKAYKAELKGDE